MRTSCWKEEEEEDDWLVMSWEWKKTTYVSPKMNLSFLSLFFHSFKQMERYITCGKAEEESVSPLNEQVLPSTHI